MLWNVLQDEKKSICIISFKFIQFSSLEYVEKCASPVKLFYWSWGWKHTICNIFLKKWLERCFSLNLGMFNVYRTIDVIYLQWLSIEPGPIDNCVHDSERIIDNHDNPWKELSSLVVWSCICHLDLLTMFIVFNYESSTRLNFQIENRW